MPTISNHRIPKAFLFPTIALFFTTPLPVFHPRPNISDGAWPPQYSKRCMNILWLRSFVYFHSSFPVFLLCLYRWLFICILGKYIPLYRFLKLKYGSLQCCANLCHTAKWLSYTHSHTHIFTYICMYVCIYILFYIPFHYGLSQEIGYRSLC